VQYARRRNIPQSLMPAGLFESEAIDGSAAARQESGIGLEDFAALHRQTHAVGRVSVFTGARLTRNAMPRRRGGRDRRSEISLSRTGEDGPAVNEGDVQTPRALKMELYSQPMTPPPMTARLLECGSSGERCRSQKCEYRRRQSPGGRCGLEPVEMRMTSPFS